MLSVDVTETWTPSCPGIQHFCILTVANGKKTQRKRDVVINEEKKLQLPSN